MGLHTIGSPALWGGFIVFVLLMLALDLGVFHRKAHVIRYREALIWSGVWVSLALLFNLGVYIWFGSERAIEFLTGYLIEKSLSVDNIFVFLIIFSALGIPQLYQHRVLFWGIFTALLMRAAMIFAGAAMLARFHWVIYVFGGFLIITGIKLFRDRKKEEHPEQGAAMRLLNRTIPSTKQLSGHHFFVRENGRWLATPLFMALMLVEICDVIFAVDSIPAIFSVTEDPFIVFTSNIFAILGLRSLFFLAGGLMEKFTYLKVGLSAVLIFVGIKMTIADFYKIPPAVSLVVVTLLLGAAVLASVLRARKIERAEAESARLAGHPKSEAGV
jgi:tellurite resistance protein TerC